MVSTHRFSSHTFVEVSDVELLVLLRSASRASLAQRARVELTQRYQPLVRGSVRHLVLAAADRDDVVASAQVGLQRAILDFDLRRGSRFPAYAKAKVRGEVLHWWRANRYPVHVPRPLHELAATITALRGRALQLDGVAPAPQDLLAELGSSAAAIDEAMRVSASRRWEAIDQCPAPPDSDEDEHARVELLLAIGQLDPRSRQLLWQRYWLDQTQAEVARDLGLSQPQVSRLEQEALAHLADLLGTVEVAG